jgi:hypothetical protein
MQAMRLDRTRDELLADREALAISLQAAFNAIPVKPETAFQAYIAEQIAHLQVLGGLRQNIDAQQLQQTLCRDFQALPKAQKDALSAEAQRRFTAAMHAACSKIQQVRPPVSFA